MRAHIREHTYEHTWAFHKSHFVWKFTRKMPDPDPAAHVLCEPAQSKRTWTFHQSHFVRSFTGKMPHTLSEHLD